MGRSDALIACGRCGTHQGVPQSRVAVDVQVDPEGTDAAGFEQACRRCPDDGRGCQCPALERRQLSPVLGWLCGVCARPEPPAPEPARLF